MNNLNLGSYNIRNTTDRYNERIELLNNIFNSIYFDICGLQEVRFTSSSSSSNNNNNNILFEDQTNELINNSYYNIIKTYLNEPFLSISDNTFRIDGNCIVYNKNKFHFLSSNDLILSNVRNAQRITLRDKEYNYTLSFTNVHLHHLLEPIDAEIRLDQIQRTIAWINELDQQESIHYSILVGDFNCSPSEIGYPFILSQGFISSYKEVHGSEPELTFPTGLQAPTMDTDGPITCDYIFFRENKWTSLSQLPQIEYNISSCTLFGNEPSPTDPTLYPSDHIGVNTVINFTSKNR